MKKFLSYLIVAVTVLSLLLSCRRTGIDIDLFQASMEILTPNIQNGEDFTIRITSSKFPLIVTAIQCEFNNNDRQIEPNKEYTPTSGNELVFTFEKVSIESTHRAEVKLTLKDPSTEKTQEVSGIYSAYQDSGVNIFIDLPPAGGSLFSRNTTPAVIGGEGVPLVIRSKLSSVVLIDFDCEFDTEGFLSEGMEIEFDKNGEWRHVFPAANITEDVYTYNSEITMSFYSDEASGDGIIVPPPAEYIKLIRPKLEMTFDPKIVNDNGVFGIQLQSSRKTMKLTTVKSSHPAFDTSGGEMLEELFDEEIDPSGITFPEYGAVKLTKSNITTDKDATYSFSIGLTDTQYTGREVMTTGSFEMKAKHAASSIDITHNDVEARFINDALVLDIDDFHSGDPGALDSPNRGIVTISTTDPLSNGEFECETVSSAGPGKVKCVKISTAEDLMSARFEITSVTEGKTAIRFFPKNNRNAAKTLTVYVRKTAALALQGEFGGVYDINGRPGGWLGVPKKTWATLASYRIKSSDADMILSNLPQEEVVEKVEIWPIENTGKLSFDIIVKVNSSYTSNMFYASCDPYGGNARVTLLNNELWLIRNTPRPVNKTLPSETTKSFSFSSSSGNVNTQLFTNHLMSFNHFVDEFYKANPSDSELTPKGSYDSANDELAITPNASFKNFILNKNLGGMTFKVENLIYNNIEYDVRYICFLYLVRRYYSLYHRPWWMYPTETTINVENYTYIHKYLPVSHWCERVVEY